MIEKVEEITVEALGDWFEIMMAARSEQIGVVPRHEQGHPADFYARWVAEHFPNGFRVVQKDEAK